MGDNFNRNVRSILIMCTLVHHVSYNREVWRYREILPKLCFRAIGWCLSDFVVKGGGNVTVEYFSLFRLILFIVNRKENIASSRLQTSPILIPNIAPAIFSPLSLKACYITPQTIRVIHCEKFPYHLLKQEFRFRSRALPLRLNHHQRN